MSDVPLYKPVMLLGYAPFRRRQGCESLTPAHSTPPPAALLHRSGPLSAVDRVPAAGDGLALEAAAAELPDTVRATFRPHA